MDNASLIDSIRLIAGTFMDDKTHLITAEVDSVDIPSRTCIVTTISQAKTTAIENVRLMTSVDDGLLFVPTVGSTVMVLGSDYNLPLIVQYSELDQILFISGSSQLSIVDGKIIFNDGSNDGLVKVVPLFQKIKAIETLLNNLIIQYNNHTHVLSSGGTAIITTAQEAGSINPVTQQSDLEDITVTH